MTPRPAQRVDCGGCRDERMHASPRGCWYFQHAVIVPKLRLDAGASIESAEKVERPNCYTQPGVLYLTPMQGTAPSGDHAA